MPLTKIKSLGITDGTVLAADIADGTISLAKLSATGSASSATFLRGDNSWGSAGATAGQVIQVVSATKTDRFSGGATDTFTDVTGVTVSITPSSASNKILIICNLAGSGNSTSRHAFRLVRGSTAVGVATSTGSRPAATVGMTNSTNSNDQVSASFNFLDSPSTTSSVTYKVQYVSENGIAIGGSYSDTNSTESYNSRTINTMTVMEIKG